MNFVWFSIKMDKRNISVFFLVLIATIVSAGRTHRIEKRSGTCLLPPYPKDGTYKIAGEPSAKPGDDFKSASLNVTCSQRYSVDGNSVIFCLDGVWSTKMPQCVQCGRLSESTDLIIGGKPATTPLPWHADIYKKYKDTYKAICGGSIISSTMIVTAAHCFWATESTKVTPSDYAVMVGKTHHRWDVNEQKFLVSDVKIPSRFQGISANYQDDIALVILSSALEYSLFVSPVCVDFDPTFERRQLQEGNLGKLAVWSDPKDKSDSLQVLEVPYIPINECLRKSPDYFKEYITSDKICAGHANGTIICLGNSGSGISFPEEQRGVTRYYLRGVASTSPSSPTRDICDPVEVIAFTQVNKHEHFLKQYFV